MARETRTDENGFYHFDDLQPGAYLVRIYVHDDEAVLSRLGVRAGRPTLHHFNLANIGHPHQDDEY
jgi:protocatechuate 3,4-dioxygenase beta subunit